MYSTAWKYGPIRMRQNLVFAACSHLASTAGENLSPRGKDECDLNF